MEALRACMNGSRKDTNGFEAAGTARQYAVSAGNRGGMIVLTSELLVGAASKFQRHSSRKLPRRCFCAGLHGLERRGMPAARQQITDHRSHGLPLSTGTGMALGSVKPVWARKIGTDRVLFESPRDTFNSQHLDLDRACYTPARAINGHIFCILFLVMMVFRLIESR
jgi:hypothetical protein